MKLYKSKKLLNIDNNPKTIKGQKYNYMTAILYLAPARTSGFNVCALASAGCMASCLNTAGRGQMGSVQLGRINTPQHLQFKKISPFFELSFLGLFGFKP